MEKGDAIELAFSKKKSQGKPPDWQDFLGIITLVIINSTINFIEENKAGNAAAALMARLAPKAKVLRNGRWNKEEATVLVPGDIIKQAEYDFMVLKGQCW